MNAFSSIVAKVKAKPELGMAAAGATLAGGTLLVRRMRKGSGSSSSSASSAKAAPVAGTLQPAVADTTGNDLAGYLSAFSTGIDARFAALAAQIANGQPANVPAAGDPIGSLSPSLPVLPPGAYDPVTVAVGITPQMPAVSTMPLPEPAPVTPVPSTPTPPSGSSSSGVSNAVVVGPPAPGTVFNPAVGWVYPGDPNTPVLSPSVTQA